MAGGSLESITIDGRYFSSTTDADVTRKLGGFENEIQSNGDGTGRKIQTRVPWSLAGIVVACDDGRGDHEFLQSISDRPDNIPISATYVDGSIYQGQGTITGELGQSNQAATAAFDAMGTGKLTKQ